MNLRPYQERCVVEAREALSTHGRVCVVMPTGAGKTITAQAIAGGEDALWLVHTLALKDQAPGRVVTIQSLLGGDRPACSLLIADECHHLAGTAERWKAVADHYPRVLGLTATPCRSDGGALGEMFSALVVGATYSELLDGGWLVPCRVVRPIEVPEESGLADEPVQAWKRWSKGRRGLAFFWRVELARRFSKAIRYCGLVHGEQPDDVRAHTMGMFKLGGLVALASVSCLTEGVDLPFADLCMLARGVSHEGSYLQAVGRVLRPGPGKKDALLIDLPGASFRFGLPTADRNYSLSGQAISQTDSQPALSQCQACGACYPSAPVCPECGWVRPVKTPRVRIWGIPLEEINGAELTPEQRAKRDWRARMEADPEARREWFQKKLERARSPMQAAVIYKSIFAKWPSRVEGWSWSMKRAR